MSDATAEMTYLEDRVVALFAELQRDLDASPNRIDLDKGQLSASAFQDESYEIGHALSRIERTTREADPSVANAAHLLRTALSYLLNYALVVKDRARTDEDFDALQRRYQEAWRDYEQGRVRGSAR
jgi:hypothetical protein